MKLKELQLDFFRNYLHIEADFSPAVNVICGDNAQGKTNLLEAISFLSCARSHRARNDREMIQFGVDNAFIRGDVFSRDRDFILEIALHRGSRRQIRSNGVPLKSAGELSGILNTVLFCPDDLQLVREGAAARRRFLDDIICQMRPKYQEAFSEYRRLYEHKTRILRDWPENPSLLDTLDDFNLRMAQTGAILIHYRAHFIRRLSQEAPLIHQEFTGGKEKLGLRYQTVKTVQDPLAQPKILLPQLLEQQEELRQAELAAQKCLAGPHKDEMEILINDIPAKEFASQGQTRTAVLSLKLGCREILYQDSGEYPLLLLDDVLSELDPMRQEFVLHHIRDGQVFITCCEEDRLSGLSRDAVFHIRNAQLEKE